MTARPGARSIPVNVEPLLDPHGDDCETEPRLDELDRAVQTLALLGGTYAAIGSELGYSNEWVHKRVGRILEHLRCCTGDGTILGRADLPRALAALGHRRPGGRSGTPDGR